MLVLVRRVALGVLAAALVIGGVGGLAYRPPLSSPLDVIGGSVTIVGTWSGHVLDTFLAMVAPFEERTSIKVRLHVTRDATEVVTRTPFDRPIDAVIVPSGAPFVRLAREQVFVPLEDVVNRTLMRSEYGQGWIDLTAVDGLIHGLVLRTGPRGLAWFDAPTLRRAGHAPPRTWEDLAALTRDAAANGIAPWCVGLKGTVPSGASASAWIQAFLLSEAGPGAFDQWVRHAIPWTDPAVRRAWQFLAPAAASSAASLPGLDGCLFRHRSMLARGDPGGGDVPGLDFFPLPMAGARAPRALLVDGEVLGVLRNTPQVRALVAYLASPEAHAVLARRGGLSPNRVVGPAGYSDPLMQRAAELLAGTDVLRSDAVELMPQAVGDAFTTGAERYVRRPADLETILDDIERIAGDSY
jgi:alpha-glucoside transport system substrate-binding protein